MKSPFPYFGGKSKVAHEVWSRFGDVQNYVEPFCGSAAVLLARPHAPRTETINDADGYVANFWRAMSADPFAVARHADWPVNEIDLIARHKHLAEFRDGFTGQMKADPNLYDARVAGWWLYGICAWIGHDFAVNPKREQLPHLGDAGTGINCKLPHLGDGGKGINRNTPSPSCKLPHLGNSGKGINRRAGEGADGPDAINLIHPGTGISVRAWYHLRDVAERMRGVRVACGDWSRVTGPSVTTKHGMTAMFFDPPYPEGAYGYGGETDREVAHVVRDWCKANGNDPKLRIALCGYDEHADLADLGWTPYQWSATGGYGNQAIGRENENRHKETVWFSPHCIDTKAQKSLF